MYRMNKKFFALLFSFIMLFSVSTSATDCEANTVSDSVIELFAENGISLSKDAKVDVVPILNASTNTIGKEKGEYYPSDSYALKVSETVDDTVFVHYVTVYSTDKDNNTTVNSDYIHSLNNNSRFGNPISGGSDAVYKTNTTIIATTSYSTHIKQGLGTLYRPLSVSWRYSTSGDTVAHITVTYRTAGSAYHLSNLAFASFDYNYPIVCAQTAPSVGSVYSSTSPCPYAIDIAVGSGMNPGTMILNYVATINGQSYSGELT